MLRSSSEMWINVQILLLRYINVEEVKFIDWFIDWFISRYSIKKSEKQIGCFEKILVKESMFIIIEKARWRKKRAGSCVYYGLVFGTWLGWRDTEARTDRYMHRKVGITWVVFALIEGTKHITSWKLSLLIISSTMRERS